MLKMLLGFGYGVDYVGGGMGSSQPIVMTLVPFACLACLADTK